ncbi:CoA transferase [Paludibacterium yongneupense]|uniref:CoA transferase n=1 Tax=Paludibacterium yongneupense TaxID=400061 RepID=UPI00041A327B|nr:CoA transferase [Paludibacterium yongneupense]
MPLSPLPSVSAREALAGLWADAGLDTRALRHVHLSGAEPALATSFALATALQAGVAACALAAAGVWQRRGGARQTIAVNMWHAAAEADSGHRVRLAGRLLPAAEDDTSGFYRCADGAWVCIQSPLADSAASVRRLLACSPGRAALADAIARRTGIELENRAQAQAAPLFVLRRFAQWDAHEQGQTLASAPLLCIDKTGTTPPLTWPVAARPLSGLRVLDMSDTRTGAGVFAARMLAAHGADVIRLAPPHLVSTAADIDTDRGQRRWAFDPGNENDRDDLVRLLADADVLIAPAAVLAAGSPHYAMLTARRGLIRASFSAFGEAGPWSGGAAGESLVQAATGFCHAEAIAAGSTFPLALPVKALERVAGSLLALSILTALHRRMNEGGDWRVRMSLARAGLWLRRLGRTGGLQHVHPPSPDTQDAAFETVPTRFGPMTLPRHAALMMATPALWADPDSATACHPPAWLPSS